MRFLMLMIPGPAAMAGTPDPAFFAAMMRYNESLTKAGVLKDLNGLHPIGDGARVVFQGDKRTVIDGPQIDAPNAVGGYWIIQTASKQEAIDWVKLCPCANGETIELRRIHEMSDYSDEIIEATAESVAVVSAGLETQQSA
jgi:hypothetical protein